MYFCTWDWQVAPDFRVSQFGCHTSRVLAKLPVYPNLQCFLSCFFENKASVEQKKM
jgi:hypothetical protein